MHTPKIEAERTVEHRDRQTAVLLYRCREPNAEPDRGARIIDTVPIETLFDLLSLAEDERKELRRPRDLFWFANGWQSWSPAWELPGFARNRRTRLLPILDREINRDGPQPRRGELTAHGIFYLRRGDSYLALVSLEGGGPPVSIRVDRRAMRIPARVAPHSIRLWSST